MEVKIKYVALVNALINQCSEDTEGTLVSFYLGLTREPPIMKIIPETSKVL